MSALLQEMFKTGIYKKKQGKVCRMTTAAALLALLAAGVYQLYNSFLAGQGAFMVYAVPLMLLALSAWIAYRAVNYARFADFLIQVEAEMRKVSWPGKDELFRSTIVVIIVMFLLTVLLFGYDIVLQFLFKWISLGMDYLATQLGIF
ncbi:MAG: preprotein translocase subunit SecE [Planctomycetia bacterium]|nr:preprotein translocase subunit SecE [Planctomycetia bacterium]